MLHSITKAAVLLWVLCLGIANASTLPLTTVASINLCTDQLLIELAQPEQILSLSNLSHQEAGSYHYKKAHQFNTNEGHAEQIFALKPDVVLAGEYTARHTLRQMNELGLNVVAVPIANSLEAMINNIALVANAIGQQSRGVALVANIRQRLALLDAPAFVTPTIAAYDPNGYTSGNLSLRGELMLVAGWDNIASKVGIEQYGTLALETLVKLAPNAIIDSPYSEGTYSRGQQLLEHPAIRQAGINPMLIHIPSNMSICAGPWTIDVIDRLVQARHKLTVNAQ